MYCELKKKHLKGRLIFFPLKITSGRVFEKTKFRVPPSHVVEKSASLDHYLRRG